MRTRILAVCAIVLLGVLQGFSPGLQPKAAFTLHGEYDLHTNAPAITIIHANGSSNQLGTAWTNLQTVVNGDKWQVLYPVTDCNTSAVPVILNGYYSLLDTNGVAKATVNVWLRMSPFMRGCSYTFAFDKYQDGVLSWQFTDPIYCGK